MTHFAECFYYHHYVVLSVLPYFSYYYYYYCYYYCYYYYCNEVALFPNVRDTVCGESPDTGSAMIRAHSANVSQTWVVFIVSCWMR